MDILHLATGRHLENTRILCIFVKLGSGFQMVRMWLLEPRTKLSLSF